MFGRQPAPTASSGHGQLQNPDTWPFAEDIFTNKDTKLGQYYLAAEQVKRLNNYKDFIPSAEQTKAMIGASAKAMNQAGYAALSSSYGKEFVSRRLDASKGAKGAPSDQPLIGDMRVAWTYVPCGPITVIAQQIKDGKG